jgi:Tol biopolymer transport system component
MSRKGNQLAYWDAKHSDTVWQLNLKDKRHAAGPPVRILSANGFGWRPDFSPDGMRVVFESDRMGYSDIWVCDRDGSNCNQLTTLRGQAGSARWSPDGRYIAFEAVVNAFYEVYVVEAAGGIPRVVSTFPAGNNGAPNWSRDGQYIYFYSAHENGPYQLWKVALKGGSPVRVTTDGGVYAMESADQRFVYYAKFPNLSSLEFGRCRLQGVEKLVCSISQMLLSGVSGRSLPWNLLCEPACSPERED